jgi:UDP-N-acetylglucosamine 2-epimerase (non-hydrolysing)
LENQSRGSERDLHLVADYDTDNVSDKVLRIIQSYTDFINRKTWKKSVD